MTSVEIELKLEAEPEDLERLLHHLPFACSACETHRLIATYFDTPDQAVHRSGHALRIRRHGRRHVQTVKADGGSAAGLFARGEWERTVSGDAPVLDAASGPLLQAIGREGASRLAPVFQTDVERMSCNLPMEGADIELSVDRGVAQAGDRAIPIAEVELELRGGDPRILFDAARALDGTAPLRLAIASKAERGYALLDPAPRQATGAEPLVLDRDMPASEALKAIVLSCIRHYRRNEALLLDGEDSEALHQAHVALRRLRTALSLFRPLLRGDSDARLIDAELRRFAAELGRARDLDLLATRSGEQAPPALVEARTHAFEHVRVQLRSARPRLILLDLVEWLGTGVWLRAPRDPARASAPIFVFAAALLDRRRRRLKRLGRGLAHGSARDAHRVRIGTKKARYAAEFFASLWTSPTARARQKAWRLGLENVQDRLGALNDLATARRILRDLGIRTERGADKQKRSSLRREAKDPLDEAMKLKPFWSG